MATATAAPLPAPIPTGIPGLDAGRGVLAAGEVTVIAGRPAMGATLLALQVVAHLADLSDFEIRYHHACRPWGGEPALRWVALRLGQDPGRVQVRGYDQQALETLGAHPRVRFIPHGCRLPMPGVVSRGLEDDGRIRLVVVDLRPASGPRTRHEQVRGLPDSVDELEALARSEATSVLVLADLPASIDRRRDHRPGLADLERAGIPLRSVSTALLLHRAGYYGGAPAHDQGTTEVAVVSLPGGVARVVRLEFEHGRFAPSSVGCSAG